MKQFAIFAGVFSIGCLTVFARFNPPDIEWQRSFGGTGEDGLFGFQEMPDKGFVLGGYSASPVGGNKTSPHFGLNDYWVIRLDKHGEKRWEQSYGGTGDERISKITVLPDGGLLLAGYSDSGVSGVKSASRLGGYDFWVVKIDGEGNKLWDKTYGGVHDDFLEVITPTGDGGFLLGGQSYSPAGGTKTAALKSWADYWLVRIDSEGNQLWDRSYSGTNAGNYNSLEVVQPAGNGDYILAGWSSTGTGADKSDVYMGSVDWWLLRVNSSGDKVWDKSFGGRGYETVWGVRESVNGSFLVGGLSSSTDGTRTSGSFGGNDFWILRIDAQGSVLWQKSHGGSGLDDCRAFVPTADGGGLFCGKSSSGVSGNKTSAHFGDNDFWVVRVDAEGDKVWETSAGGSGQDDPFYVLQTSDGGYLMGGRSASPPSGNKTSPSFGFRDIWVVKLDKEKHQISPNAAVHRDDPTKGFSFEVSGLSNIYVAEYTTNMVDWIPFQTNTIPFVTGVIKFHDATNATTGLKFFRTRQLNPQATP